jgi:hypothetical protein
MPDEDNEPELNEQAEGDGDEGENVEVNDEAVSASPVSEGPCVYVNGELNSGPYESEEAAQAFIDTHLDGEGEVR